MVRTWGGGRSTTGSAGVCLADSSRPPGANPGVSAMEQNPTDHEPTCFDYEQLLARCMGNIEFAERVLDKFQQRFAGDLDELDRLLEARQSEGLARLAHRLKGASANVSAPRLQARAARLEELARAERLDEACPVLEELRGEWSQFVGALSVLDAPAGQPS
jgi:HPt (histidine-containing phosphotransfer) domain-containing protein